MADDTAPEKNTTGEIDPSKWDEQPAVTGRPNDTPEDNSTFADRVKVRAKPKAQENVSEPTSAPRKRPAKK